MKPEDIRLSDWRRIFIGPVPPEFYIELIIRGAVVYLLLVITMRLMGRRVVPGTSRLQLSAIVSLGSAIGVPLLSPSNGMLAAFIITFIIIVFTRLFSWLAVRNRGFEKAVLGSKESLVDDGILNIKNMKDARITRERLFAQLRFEHMTQLGMVKRMYIEASGTFTVIENEKPQPGLLLLPDWDKEFVAEMTEQTDKVICVECGDVKPEAIPANEKGKCPHCGASHWTKAVVEKEKEK